MICIFAWVIMIKRKLKLITMKKIFELLFCLVALIALLISSQYLESGDDVQNDELIASSDNQESSAENVAMLSDQE